MLRKPFLPVELLIGSARSSPRDRAIILEVRTPKGGSQCGNAGASSSRDLPEAAPVGSPRVSVRGGLHFYREPDNSDRVPGAEERFRWLYLTGEHDDPAYRRLMTRALAGPSLPSSRCGRIPVR